MPLWIPIPAAAVVDRKRRQRHPMAACSTATAEFSLFPYDKGSSRSSSTGNCNSGKGRHASRIEIAANMSTEKPPGAVFSTDDQRVPLLYRETAAEITARVGGLSLEPVGSWTSSSPSSVVSDTTFCEGGGIGERGDRAAASGTYMPGASEAADSSFQIHQRIARLRWRNMQLNAERNPSKKRCRLIAHASSAAISRSTAAVESVRWEKQRVETAAGDGHRRSPASGAFLEASDTETPSESFVGEMRRRAATPLPGTVQFFPLSASLKSMMLLVEEGVELI